MAKNNKYKRNKILVSGLLSFLIAALVLGTGVYIGLIMLRYNYITIGVIDRNIISLFLCSCLFIALGVVGISVAIKLLYISSSTNFIFYTKKSIVISALCYFGILSLVGLTTGFLCFMSIFGMGIMTMVLVLSSVCVGLNVLCFFLCIKELLAFLKKIKNGEIAIQIEYPKRYFKNNSGAAKALQGQTLSRENVSEQSIENIVSKLTRLDEMKSIGVINMQEYCELKSYYMDKITENKV